jgi:hypothetical protein
MNKKLFEQCAILNIRMNSYVYSPQTKSSWMTETMYVCVYNLKMETPQGNLRNSTYD